MNAIAKISNKAHDKLHVLPTSLTPLRCARGIKVFLATLGVAKFNRYAPMGQFMKCLRVMLADSINGMVLANGEEHVVEYVTSTEEVEGYLAMMREALPAASCSDAKDILNGYINVLAKFKDNENCLFHGKIISLMTMS